MNISAKLKVSASKSATSPSCKTLCVSVKTKPTAQSSTFVFSERFTQRQKTKELALPHRYELNNIENFRNKTGELKQKTLNLPKLSR